MEAGGLRCVVSCSDGAYTTHDNTQLMDQYGPVFKISVPPKIDGLVICDPHIAAQVRYMYTYVMSRSTDQYVPTDTVRHFRAAEQVIERPDVFQKRHFKHNKMIRGWVGQGVFTADDDEEVRQAGRQAGRQWWDGGPSTLRGLLSCDGWDPIQFIN